LSLRADCAHRRPQHRPRASLQPLLTRAAPDVNAAEGVIVVDTGESAGVQHFPDTEILVAPPQPMHAP
jgi:hypothetical protein